MPPDLPFQSFPQNFTLFKINNPAAIRLEKLFFGPDVMPSYLLEDRKMAPHATFVGGTFERMKAKQTKLFKERKQSETKCTSLINIRDNF